MPPIPRLTGDLLSAFSLLTRLPVPAHDHSGAASAWAWPVVGLAVGGFGALAVWLGGLAGLPPGALAALAMAAMALASGGLHEDGLADTADGLFGGRDRERRLAIMKDSHIGSFGTLALVLVTLAAWSALTGLIASDRAVPALMAAAALSRAPMAAIMAALPPARASGLSAASGRPPAPAALIAVLAGAALCLLLAGTAGLAAILAAALLSAALARAAQNRIGGQTGDILGASQQLSFAASLALLA